VTASTIKVTITSIVSRSAATCTGAGADVALVLSGAADRSECAPTLLSVK